VILLAEHDEPSLAAKKKRQHVALKTATSTPKNRVWNFFGSALGRISCEPASTPETATGSVQFSYETASGQAYYYTRDHEGSVREMCNSSGSILARYSYDPYGRTMLVTGSNLSTKQYAGMYMHQTSGLYLTKYRGFDSSTGRWLSRDPLPNAEKSQGPNLYEYVKNDPIDMTDPLGLKTCWKYVIMTNYGDSPGDKVGNHGNKLGPGDAAVGYNNPPVPHTGNGPGSMPGPGATPVLPIGTQVTTYPNTGGSSNVTVNDIGNYDKVHPDLAPSPSDFIDIWNPKKSKHGDSTEGWISIEVDKCKDCPPGWGG
jgi:RHS repeat-associated protein